MDRRFLFAMALIMAILLGPGLIFKKPPPATVSGDSLATAADSGRATGAGETAPERAIPEPAPRGRTPGTPAASAPTPGPQTPEDTVVVVSGLYRYTFATRGARLLGAMMNGYTYTIEGLKDRPVELLEPDSDLLALELIAGRDTVRLDQWVFTPSSDSLTVAEEPVELSMSASHDGISVDLDYRFKPDEYQVMVRGTVTGLGPNGGLLLIGMGPGLAHTESNRRESKRNMGFVTRNGGSKLTRFSSLDPGETVTKPGPFEWVAVKSKYFVAAVMSIDEGSVPLSGVTATVAPDAPKNPELAAVWVSRPVTADGLFEYRLYAGPMEYPRLKALGHGFYDVNPYGWPGLRSLIRPVAVAARWVLVWMHDNLNLHYGLVLILFGVLVRVVLWPLNQKAMRSSIRMQAVQPLMKEIQEKHKDKPDVLQKEMFKLYKEHNVNPLGGCWPMLLPFPILIALFFVFQNTIELRGVSFMWLPDLSQKDPLYIIPVLMGVSMFLVSKVGQIGVEPNPQMKMMLYVMPVMMTVLFAGFASGLNLYYAVQNLVSVPQQWYLAHERLRLNPPKKPVDPGPAPSRPEGQAPRPRQKKLKRRH